MSGEIITLPNSSPTRYHNPRRYKPYCLHLLSLSSLNKVGEYYYLSSSVPHRKSVKFRRFEGTKDEILAQQPLFVLLFRVSALFRPGWDKKSSQKETRGRWTRQKINTRCCALFIQTAGKSAEHVEIEAHRRTDQRVDVPGRMWVTN